MALKALFSEPKSTTRLAYLLLCAAQSEEIGIRQKTFDLLYGSDAFSKALNTLNLYGITSKSGNMFCYEAPTTYPHLEAIAKLVLSDVFERLGIIDQHSLKRDKTKAFRMFVADPVCLRAAQDFLLQGDGSHLKCLLTINAPVLHEILEYEIRIQILPLQTELFSVAIPIIGYELSAESLESARVKTEKEKAAAASCQADIIDLAGVHAMLAAKTGRDFKFRNHPDLK